MKIINYIKSKRRYKPKPHLDNWFHPWAIVATFFWMGRGPFVPGIWGSIAGLPFGWLIAHHYGMYGLLTAIILITTIGTLASNWVERTSESHDASLIVIDEVAGVWIPLLIVPTMGDGWLAGYLVALFWFIFFDIIKPWPIGWVDKHVSGGFGVMVDDLVAGIIALGFTYASLIYIL